MRPSMKSLLIALIILASAIASAQRNSQRADYATLLARLSYANTWQVDFGEEGFRQVCFTVDSSGYYRMQRLTMKGYIELVQGTLPESEVRKLEQLLEDPEFRTLTSSSDGIILKGAERFVVEVPRDNSMQRIFLTDPDRENPFPRSARRVVRWLQHFRAEGAEPLDASASDICPGAVVKPLQPTIASR